MEKDIVPDDVALKLHSLCERLSQDSEDESALIERGRLFWALGKRSEAINDYLAAQKLNPEGKARELLKATYEILNFYNKDLFNP